MNEEKRMFSVGPKGETEQLNISAEEFAKKEKEAKEHAERIHLGKIKIWGKKNVPHLNEKHLLEIFEDLEKTIFEQHRLNALREIDEILEE